MGLLEPATLSSLPKVKDGVAGDVGRFLNRILGIKVEQQNLVSCTKRCGIAGLIDTIVSLV